MKCNHFKNMQFIKLGKMCVLVVLPCKTHRKKHGKMKTVDMNRGLWLWVTIAVLISCLLIKTRKEKLINRQKLETT